LWTPPYWSRVDGGYAFHAGYWAEQVGFYGGTDYGYGYTGDGYRGGRWENDSFFYNRAVNKLGSLDIANEGATGAAPGITSRYAACGADGRAAAAF
jgi:hypothetical protein